MLKGPEPPPAESKEAAKKEAEKKEGEKKEPEKKEEPPKPQPPQPPPQPPPPQPAPPPATPPAAGDKPKEAPPAPPKPPDPLVEAFLGKRQAFLYAGGPAALDHLFRLLEALPAPLRFVLVTPPLEPEVLARLARRREQVQGVVLEPRLATFYDALVYRNAFRLFREADFPVALVPLSDDLKGHAEIFFHLAELVKTGVPEAVAWQAVTVTPARFLGLADRLGSLAPGREASFAVYRGDPFAGLPCLAHTYIRGEKVYSANPPDAPSAAPSSIGGGGG
ncbi:MAG: amidohydrolase family protein [Planctomycetes bacterium]|nr:amidohydrolase family protein [Planctomycetota bacterium]